MIEINGCCFSGHRIIPQEIAAQLQMRLIDGVTYVYHTFGITQYFTGGALGFDTLAAYAVIQGRAMFPEIRLILALPCRDQADRWSPTDIARYEGIKRQANEVIYLSERYSGDCMHRRNRYMVDRSSVCICYLTKQSGGTAYTVNYAINKGLQIYNLAKKKSV